MLLWLAFLGQLASAALAADLPACPDAPAAYTGTDDAAAQIAALRADDRSACLATAARLEAIDADTHAASDLAHADFGDVHAAVDATTAAVQAIPTPPPAATPTSSYDGPTSSDFDSAMATLHGDGWVLVGFLSLLVFGLPFLKLMTPWLDRGEA